MFSLFCCCLPLRYLFNLKLIDLHFHWPWATHIFLALLRTAASDGTFGEKGVIYIFTASGMQQATVKVSKLRLTH